MYARNLGEWRGKQDGAPIFCGSHEGECRTGEDKEINATLLFISFVELYVLVCVLSVVVFWLAGLCAGTRTQNFRVLGKRGGPMRKFLAHRCRRVVVIVWYGRGVQTGCGWRDRGVRKWQYFR